MAPAHNLVFLSQKPSTEDGIHRPAILFLAWLVLYMQSGEVTGRHHVVGPAGVRGRICGGGRTLTGREYEVRVPTYKGV